MIDRHGQEPLTEEERARVLMAYRDAMAEALDLRTYCPCRRCHERVSLALGTIGYVVGFIEHLTVGAGGTAKNVRRVINIGREEARQDLLRLDAKHREKGRTT